MEGKKYHKKEEKFPKKREEKKNEKFFFNDKRFWGLLARAALGVFAIITATKNSHKKKIYKKALKVIHQADRNRIENRRKKAEDEREYLEQVLENTDKKLKGFEEEKEECLGGDQDFSNIIISKEGFKELKKAENALLEGQEETTWKFFPKDIIDLKEKERNEEIFDKTIDGPVQKRITEAEEEDWRPNKHLLVDALLKRKKYLNRELDILEKAENQNEKPLTNPQIALAIHFIEEGGEYEIKKSEVGAKKAMEDFNLASNPDSPKKAVYHNYAAISKDNEKDPLREKVALRNLKAVKDFFEEKFPKWNGPLRKIDEQIAEHYRGKGEDADFYKK